MVDDFWLMVWQQNVEKIVMLTNPIEMGTVLHVLKYAGVPYSTSSKLLCS